MKSLGYKIGSRAPSATGKWFWIGNWRKLPEWFASLEIFARRHLAISFQVQTVVEKDIAFLYKISEGLQFSGCWFMRSRPRRVKNLNVSGDADLRR